MTCQKIEQCKLQPCQDWLESVLKKSSLKGLCHPWRMRALMRSTLELLAQLFQIPFVEFRKLFESRLSPES